MTNPSLRQLDIFAQMVAAGSLAGCARTLGVSSAEIERDMASLEMRLGYRLFDDLRGAARLTPAGRRTAQAMTLLAQDDPDQWAEEEAPAPAPQPGPPPAPPELLLDADAQLPAAPKAPNRAIILATPAPVFGHFQDALTAFEEANDDIAITLDLSVQSAVEAARAIESLRADIAYFYALEEPAGLPSRYGWSEQVNLYAGADHPLARANSVSRGDLAITPQLAIDPRNGLRPIIDAALARGGARLGPVVLETDNMFDIITTLREGAGCFAAFGPMARDLGRMSGIRRLSLDVPLPAIEVRQTVNERSLSRPGVQALADFLFL
ncbi:LysR family transcriptional regulator [Sphingobium sp. AP49]|uniref:LysR family transcriptional regulator n=1 Tax=Sphingobium sp. AP49 TaxID=1144307 RepID=UPI00026EDFBA|nr:LysR family transcriptional regulator [Sphingobium sp. AP49]WHO38314.1 LysR family transcriptional regulator [Sphingobium sp. AP49]